MPKSPPELITLDLDPLLAQAHQLPQSPGVYHFLNQEGYPVYIGKSIDIRQRVLSHLYAAKRDSKENRLAAATQRIRCEVTSGELGALLLESQQIKSMLPLYNRRLRAQRQLFTWELKADQEYHTVFLRDAVWPPAVGAEYFGLYKSKTQAKAQLAKIARDNSLCKRLLGLESGGKSCFGVQLKRCMGACLGKESCSVYNARLKEALIQQAVNVWPFPGPIAVQEGGCAQVHIIDQWFYLGTVAEDELPTASAALSASGAFPALDELPALSALLAQPKSAGENPTALLDRDSYRILIGMLNNKKNELSLRHLG